MQDNLYNGLSVNAYTGEVGNNTFGGGTAETRLGIGVGVAMVAIIVLVIVLRRKWILPPLLIGLLLLPVGQTLVLGGLHLYVTRILTLVGLIRAIISRVPEKSLFGAGFNALDKTFIAWILIRTLAFIVRFPEMGAVANQFGGIWDVLGGYLLLRWLIHDKEDILRTITTLAYTAILLGVTMVCEKVTRFNVYGWLKSTPIIPEIRNGSTRAQGPFHHAILAGTFAATLLPLFFWLWKSRTNRSLGLLGILGSSAAVFASASSTPVSAYLAAIAGMCLWPMRNNMRFVRQGLVIGLIALNFVMTAPVWWAIEHVDLAGGSAGEHRAELIDSFIRHFGEWWLVGTSNNANWGYEMWDVGNQFIAEGISGGLATFLLFIAIVCCGFKWIGRARKANRGDLHNEWHFWFLGAALFSNVVAYFGISYFDQTRYSWFALLAIVCVATAPCFPRNTSTESISSVDVASQGYPVYTNRHDFGEVHSVIDSSQKGDGGYSTAKWFGETN